MNLPLFSALQVGDALPALALPPLRRHTLALFAGGSGDHNPLHLDLDFARQAGFADVFAQGMLGMAWLGRLLTGWVPQAQLRQWSVRFTAVTHIGDQLTCRGRVVEKLARAAATDESRVRVAIEMVDAAGEVKIAGEALVALPDGTA